MRSSILSLNLLALAVYAYPQPQAVTDQHKFQAPSVDDSKSCQ